MYLPWRGSTLQSIDAGSTAEMAGAYDETTKWMRGYGTRLVWNSVTSTLRAPSKRSDAVSDEMIWAIRRLRLVYVGRSMSRLRRQMSYSASLSTMKETSVGRGASASRARSCTARRGRRDLRRRVDGERQLRVAAVVDR